MAFDTVRLCRRIKEKNKSPTTFDRKRIQDSAQTESDL